MNPPANRAIPRRDVDAKYRRAELRAAWDHNPVALSNTSTVLIIELNPNPGCPQVAVWFVVTFATIASVSPRATVGPDAGLSVEVETVTPAVEAAMGPPTVAPVRVMVRAPAATGATVTTTYCDAVAVVKMSPEAAPADKNTSESV